MASDSSSASRASSSRPTSRQRAAVDPERGAQNAAIDGGPGSLDARVGVLDVPDSSPSGEPEKSDVSAGRATRGSGSLRPRSRYALVGLECLVPATSPIAHLREHPGEHASLRCDSEGLAEPVGLLERASGSRRIARGGAAGGQGSCSPRMASGEPTERASSNALFEIREAVLVLDRAPAWQRPSSRARSHAASSSSSDSASASASRAILAAPVVGRSRGPRFAPALAESRCLRRRRLERVDESGARARDARRRARVAHGSSSRRREAPPPRPPPRDRSLRGEPRCAATSSFSPRRFSEPQRPAEYEQESSAPWIVRRHRSSARS